MERDLERHLNQALLEGEIQQALRKTVFSSGLSVSPRQTGRLARELVQTFFEYCAIEDNESVRSQGERLAVDGLGVSSALAVVEVLSRVCRRHSNPLEELPDVAGRYVTNLLEGYIGAREQVLLQEQERTFRALLRAQGQTGRSDG